MHRAVALAWLVGLLAPVPLCAQEPTCQAAVTPGSPGWQLGLDPGTDAVPAADAPPPAEVGVGQASLYRPAWGLAALRVIPEGPRVAPNGLTYHPNFSMDLNLN